MADEKLEGKIIPKDKTLMEIVSIVKDTRESTRPAMEGGCSLKFLEKVGNEAYQRIVKSLNKVGYL